MSEAERYLEFWRAAYAIGYCNGATKEDEEVIQRCVKIISDLADEGLQEVAGMDCLDWMMKQTTLKLA